MVYLALESVAALEAIKAAKINGAAVGVGSDAMTQAEHYRIAAEGLVYCPPNNWLYILEFGMLMHAQDELSGEPYAG